MAAGAVVQPQTQMLISLLSERGDEMDVGQMRKLILRLGDELGAAQQVAGVTAADFQRVEAECATAAGLAEVERRVDAVSKMLFDASATQETDVQVGAESKKEKKEKKLIKRLRKKQRKREQAALDAAMHGAAVEAVDGVATAESATEILLGQHVGTNVNDNSMLEAALMAALTEVEEVVAADEQQVSNVESAATTDELGHAAMHGDTVVDHDALATTLAAALTEVVRMQVCDMPAVLEGACAVNQQEAYGADHIAENANGVTTSEAAPTAAPVDVLTTTQTENEVVIADEALEAAAITTSEVTASEAAPTAALVDVLMTTQTTMDKKQKDKLRNKMSRQKKRNNKAFKARSSDPVTIMSA
jgi:hypothetical protein